MSSSSGSGQGSSDDFSVFVLASDLGIDARPFLSPSDRTHHHEDDEEEEEEEEEDNWHDCTTEDFSDLEALQVIRVQGSDKSSNRILRIVGKYFPAPVVSAERLKKYVFHKILTELPEGPFCIVYMHSAVQKEDNSPGITILRWIYEELPPVVKDRLQVVYFVHPGLRSRLLLATLGRFFLSGGVYWKIKYISRLQYLWEHVRKEEIEVPEFVKDHDDVLENRPLTDYGIEPDPMHLSEIPAMAGGNSYGRHEDRWVSREYTT